MILILATVLLIIAIVLIAGLLHMSIELDRLHQITLHLRATRPKLDKLPTLTQNKPTLKLVEPNENTDR